LTTIGGEPPRFISAVRCRPYLRTGGITAITVIIVILLKSPDEANAHREG
jgi:hypothetical protein